MTEFVTLILTTSTVISHVIIFVVLFILISKKQFKVAYQFNLRIKKYLKASHKWFPFLIVLIGSLSSLYYSEVSGFLPCELCWYERIAMYPLVPFLLVGWIMNENIFLKWSILLTVPGIILTIYHYQLQLTQFSINEICDLTVPCTERWIWEYGYISMPMMALTIFLSLTIISIYVCWRKEDNYYEI